MANNVSIIITAKDNASKALKGVSTTLDDQVGFVESARRKWLEYAAVTAAAGSAFRTAIGGVADSIDSANRLQGAITGLNSVSRAFGEDASAAGKAARDLAGDGLMSVTDSATGLKNLLASGFNLDQSVTLMKRFKDSAAFGRQASLGFGQAVASATEGIKNGNSILVDNAGVTKNLSVMMEEAGFSAQDLMNASSDASVRQAIFNGILKETNAQAGNAAEYADSAAGKQAEWAAQTEVLKQQIGMSLQPALLELLRVATPIITAISDWVAKNPELASGLVIGAAAVTGIVTAIGALNTAIGIVGPLFGGLKNLASNAFDGIGSKIDGVTGKHDILGSKLSTQIVMPALATAAVIAGLDFIIAKTQETINVVKSVATALDNSRKVGSEVDAYMKKLVDEGKISQEQYQSYIKKTEQTAKDSVKEMQHKYDGFFGPMNRSLDNLFVRMSGAESQYKGTGYGGYASGTTWASGGVHELAERGPELVYRRGSYNLPEGSKVVPADQTAKMMGGGGVTIGAMHIHNEVDAGMVIRQIGWELTTR